MSANCCNNISDLVEAELARFDDADRRSAFRALLCAPIVETRPWDYYDNRAVDVCIFARAPAVGALFAHSLGGYAEPWGVLYKEPATLGMDAQWYLYLEDAFISSGVWAGPRPAGFEIR